MEEFRSISRMFALDDLMLDTSHYTIQLESVSHPGIGEKRERNRCWICKSCRLHDDRINWLFPAF